MEVPIVEEFRLRTGIPDRSDDGEYAILVSHTKTLSVLIM